MSSEKQTKLSIYKAFISLFDVFYAIQGYKKYKTKIKISKKYVKNAKYTKNIMLSSTHQQQTKKNSLLSNKKFHLILKIITCSYKN